ncbi:hypothetical protein F2Q69_00022798 [Brassica cretica]|uniref:Uncharacterized protein n=1 Tax=Brassica cretica TaxID=69181 RepID=A0A8S9Q621_BRACR|nr:hypothetical protein F2Q69_00022798 [Brassica cretica]
MGKSGSNPWSIGIKQQHGFSISLCKSNANAICQIKLIFQASIYQLWKERNACIFIAVSSPPRIIHHALDRLLRDLLLSIKAAPPPAQSPLQFYWPP